VLVSNHHDTFLAAGENPKKLENTDFMLDDAVFMVECKKSVFLSV
jgi:hypothetical protein